ncbi:MAG: peptidoglycan DD-metalloendopeptidase family protein [Eubacterium sp.]|nr:peptidoglycan DD-metalloendopeptidase family protein [Eubacterium sp.]
MMNKALVKIISVAAVLCVLVTADTPARCEVSGQTLEEQREQLQRDLDEVETKLKKLSEQSRDTEEYIEVLDKKISFLNEQYKLIKDDADAVQNKVAALENTIALNEEKIADSKREIKSLNSELSVLTERFNSVYAAYCARLRALYISGEQTGLLSFVLNSDGISSLLTRYQMVSAVSKRDGELLSSVKSKTKEIVKTQNELNDKTITLKATIKNQKEDESRLKVQKASLLKKQEQMEQQKALIEQQQIEENKLLKQLHDKTKEYGEFRDTTQKELEKIDADIEAADKKYPEPETQTTTTEQTTADKEQTTEVATKPSRYLKLTYPCPKYTKITCAFGAYRGHTGCDFSTNGHENQKIVAAESGTVILVKLLETSYGHYIVIRHDKKTKGGDSVYTLYAHNNKIIVSEGQYVKKGQRIANSGSTGNSTGPHCHFEVRVGGSSQSYAQNPENYL